MNFLDWNDEKMGIGIKIIDDQHKELLKIINELSSSIYNNSQKRNILIIVDKLINYTEYHFKTEEKLFDKFKYKKTEIHKKEHSLFLEKFLEIKNKISKNSFYLERNANNIADDILGFMITWFLEHIAGSDRQYIQLFKENGID